MKIAFPSSDGETISTHFGSAPIYTILTLDNQKVVEIEHRQNEGASQHNNQIVIRNHNKFDLLQDCQTLIAGGIGENAIKRLGKMGITVFLVKEKNIQEAVELFLVGKLTHEESRIHKHQSQ